MSNLAIDYNNPNALRKAGLDALVKELGPLGMTLFIRQYDGGHGDYTAEREELLKGIPLEEIEMEISNN
ncbi:MAG: hypothetical protein LBR85_02790 [Oscillospiraceae bacterium]|jgi:hypothetical protein|nr:hypothetical protein [Oscillospiraceae bacterium]